MTQSAALYRFFYWYWKREHDAPRRILNHEEFLRAEHLLPEEFCLTQPGEVVLELGSGGGRTARALAHRGARVLALDLCARRTARLARIGSSRDLRLLLCAGRAEELPLRDSSVRLVILQTTAMHLDITRTVAEITRVLRADGQLILLEPRPYHPLVALYRALWSAGTPSRPVFLTDRDLGRIAAAFHDHRISYHGLLSPLVPPTWMPRMIGWDRFLFRHLPRSRQLAWFALMIASTPRPEAIPSASSPESSLPRIAL